MMDICYIRIYEPGGLIMVSKKYKLVVVAMTVWMITLGCRMSDGMVNTHYDKHVNNNVPIKQKLRYPLGTAISDKFGIDKSLNDVSQHNITSKPSVVKHKRRKVKLISDDNIHLYDKFIADASREYKVSEKIIRGVIHAESRWNSKAISSEGALGLMQLMPRTARRLGVKKPLDPKQNIMGGTKYLSELLSMYDGNINKALAAYRTGPGGVKKHGWKSRAKYVKAVRKNMK